MTNIPELEPHCGSWIVTDPKDGQVYELFRRRNVEIAAKLGWQVETTLQYLTRINQQIKAEQDQ